MTPTPTPLIDALTEIGHCSCLMRFLWTADDTATYEQLLAGLMVIVENHRKLKLINPDH
jgi:hypothetical protein